MPDRCDENRRGAGTSIESTTEFGRRRPMKVLQRIIAAVALAAGFSMSHAQTGATGTGFFITPSGYVATCYHVVDGYSQFAVLDSEGKSHPATVVLRDASNDLAVLKVEGTNFPALSIRNSSDVRKGNTVFTLGFPNPGMQGLDAKVTEGIVSGLAGIPGQPNSFQVSVPVQPGNSGGPLLDSSGAVIGIVSAKLNQAAALRRSGSLPENVNYAIKSNYLLELLATAPNISKGLLPPTRLKTSGTVTSLVVKAEPATVLIVAQRPSSSAATGAP